MFAETTWVIDTETDGFNPTKFHCLSAGQDPDNISSTSDYQEMREFFGFSAETIIGHNIQRADILWIENLLDISLDHLRIIDTLPLSWALFPDLKSHGLYDWGNRLGIEKVPIEDWVNLPVEKYIERCEQDVRINLRLWDCILSKLLLLYDNPDDLNRYVDYLSFKMKCARLQEQNKWEFDLRNAHESLVEMMEEREKRVTELSRSMPKVPVLGRRTVPKRMYNKDGELTKLGQSWLDQLQELGLTSDTSELEFIKGYEEPNPGSQQQIKDWLFSLGWVPDVIEYKKKDDGSVHEVPKINKDKQKGGGVSDSVKKLMDKEPTLSSLDGLSILNHRIPLLSGFISSSSNGFLSARIAGLTNTLRFVHSEIVNLPKVNLPYAKAVRGSLIAGEGKILIGSDMSSLEDRLKQHFMYPLDPKFVQDMMSPDYDPHLYIAEKAKKVTPEQRKRYALNDKNSKLDAEDKSLKPIRDVYKNGNYSMQYGAWPPRVAITCGISLQEAEELFDTYWKVNWSIKEIAKQQKVIKVKCKYSFEKEEKWLYNPINKWYYNLRSEKDVFSTLIQGTASFVFDKWLHYVLDANDDLCNSLIGQFHDEFILRAQEGQEEEVKDIINTAILELNKELNLNRELGVGIQIGKRYSDIH